MKEPFPENRISRDYINSLPPLRYHGPIEMINRPELVKPAVKHLKRQRLLGIDTESRPAFKKGESYPISLIQIATLETVFLFHLPHIELSDGLVKILSSRRIRKVGIALNNDLDKLGELRCFRPAGFIDLSKMASEKGIIQQGARSLVARYMHKRLIKSSQRTNWARKELTEKQKLYAATDAWICLIMHPLILADQRKYPPDLEPEFSESNSGLATA